MKRILKTYIPSACITFTLTALFTCTSNLLQGYMGIYNHWFLEMLAFIIIIEILDFALGYVDFNSYSVYFVTELVLTYIAMLLFGYICNWFSFTVQSLLLISIIFLVVFSCVHSYFYKMSRIQADEINSLLNK